ncbi:hypothetical protein MKW98_011260 [Papaver atlanticum]|uniref:S-protein homolog n=1 Tax=Papaver atlanticum TaxID=357466 RepID=A0AAD4SWU2_9MAGN|nr:hypothetical protein MKW98_011260 [Papaver atlanticum]
MGANGYGNTSLLLLLVLLFLVSECASKTVVHIQNDIEGYEVSLDMHCWSYDDDLGPRSLHQGDEWHWEFNPSYSSTHFVCYFRWYDNWDYNWKNGTSIVYDKDLLHDNYSVYCFGDFQYSARRDGFYLYRRDKSEWQKRNDWHVE